MPSVSAVAFTVVLLFVSAVPLCAAKCAFTVQIGLAIDSKLSMKIANVSLLKDCLLFLERHADTYAAVAYNEVSLDCCTVPAKESYKLIESAGWSTYYIEKQQQPPQSNEGSVVFNQSGLWTVPAGVSVLKVLAVGGGGGGGGLCSTAGGGGSGFVNYLTLTAEPFQTFTITVGEGGNASSNGRPSVFGNNLLTAAGGYSSKCSCRGASGGSGGGAGCALTGQFTGSGGSGGSSGTSGETSITGGDGQGSSFTSQFSQFKLNTLSAGAGAAGLAGNSTFYPGGGGGGGVLINGTGPNAAAGACSIDGFICESVPASGYGAGGNGGSVVVDNDVWNYYEGGAGASGLIYIEYY